MNLRRQSCHMKHPSSQTGALLPVLPVPLEGRENRERVHRKMTTSHMTTQGILDISSARQRKESEAILCPGMGFRVASN